mmetsp:Transcript_5774/g.10338  ORF Transcript_5774/g.10338 Transcript_5774/m.10338 type:complete len:643 (+) Transcript_5774:67-1995(+)
MLDQWVSSFCLAHALLFHCMSAADRAELCHDPLASSSGECALPERGSALLQRKRHRVKIEEPVNFGHDDELLLEVETGQAPLNETGFNEVNAGCCQLTVDRWLRDFITAQGWEICNAGGLNGYIPFLTCNINMTYEAMLIGLTKNLGSPCPWIREIGSTKACLPYPPECPTGTFNPTWHRRRTCSSTTPPTEPPTSPPTEPPVTAWWTTQALTTTEATTTIQASTMTTVTTTRATMSSTTTPTTTSTTGKPLRPNQKSTTTTTTTTTTTKTTTTTEGASLECCAPRPAAGALLQSHSKQTQSLAKSVQARRLSSNSTLIAEFPCDEHALPIQVLMKGQVDYYQVAELDIPTGEYNEVYRIPLAWTTPPMEEELNSAGINPIDGRAYATAKVDKNYYLIRHDKSGLEFVALLPKPTKFFKKAVGYNTATFSLSGKYYLVTKGTVQHMIVISGLDGITGKSSQNALDLADFTNSLTGFSLGNTAWIADMAAVPLDLDGSGEVVDYAFMLDQNAAMWIVKCTGDTFTKWKLKATGDGLVPARKNGFGAAWSYQERVFFASNVGRGVYEVDISSIDLTALTVTMLYVGKSKATTKNDGMNCLDSESPFPEQGDCPDEYVEVDAVNGQCPSGAVERSSLSLIQPLHA